ncbi:proteasome subunit beta type-6-like isoform X1 [Solanum tuberosum]|uniref:proteasome subunit beta type-6-like isoform X1 n=1 Tax=Solanum tuberosum TaxID=4113 RepID=UPI0003D285BF|nr:PREDICTED: proteasome subunit beta type-6-like isoform X1 [Solanum tuberosum]
MDKSSLDVEQPHSMGTTIIGVTYNGGVVLGADSRTSTGMYVANRASDKITQLTDNVYVCRSGSVNCVLSLCVHLTWYVARIECSEF